MVSLQYAYSPYIWPSLIAALLVSVLGLYSLKNRNVPGALPFTFASMFALFWLFAMVLEFSAVNLGVKIFWRKFGVMWQLPSATAIICFLLEYARPKRWLTRRNLVLLSILPLLAILLIITNNFHHLFWVGFDFDGALVANLGPVAKLFLVYVLLLSLINLIVLVWLFINSPQNRWPVVIILIGQLMVRLFFFTDILGRAPFNFSIVSIGLAIASVAYAVVLFRFRILGPANIARQAVIEQIPIGMLVLDDAQRVNSLNPAAERMLQVTSKFVKGQHIHRVLPAYPQESWRDDEYNHEFDRVNEGKTHNFQLNIIQLKDWRELTVGQLLLLTDVTEQRKAQARLLEQGRVVATLQERELLARELHDDLAQVFAFIDTQGQTVRRLINRGDVNTAEGYLDRLVEVARTGEVDIRETILGMRLTLSERGLLPTVEKYLAQFQKNNAIQTELVKSEHFDEIVLDPMVEVQVLRVLQEALTNIRKHAQARQVMIKFDRKENAVCITIKDDGRGFELVENDDDSDSHYGLKMMRERIDTIGGTIRLSSQPGQGTEIYVCVPINEKTVMG